MKKTFPTVALDRHGYVVAGTGAGKSELLKALIVSIMRRFPKGKASVVLIDPHGDLAKEVRDVAVSFGRENVVYFNPMRKNGYMPAFNPFDQPGEAETQAQALARAISELIPEANLSLQMQAILKPCVSVLLEKGGSSLAELQRFMDDSANADLLALGRQSGRENRRAFFQNAFVSPRYAATKHSVFTKLQSLLNDRAFHDLTCSPSTVDLPKLLRE